MNDLQDPTLHHDWFSEDLLCKIPQHLLQPTPSRSHAIYDQPHLPEHPLTELQKSADWTLGGTLGT
jgi:hypothetical protein